MPHVMLADPAHQPLGDEYARSQSLRHCAGDEPDAAPIVLHRHMLEVLLDCCNRDETTGQFAGGHSFAKLTAGEFAEEDFRFGSAHDAASLFNSLAIW